MIFVIQNLVSFINFDLGMSVYICDLLSLPKYP